MPSRRHGLALPCPPFRPSRTILIISPAVYCLRLIRRDFPDDVVAVALLSSRFLSHLDSVVVKMC